MPPAAARSNVTATAGVLIGQELDGGRMPADGRDDPADDTRRANDRHVGLDAVIAAAIDGHRRAPGHGAAGDHACGESGRGLALPQAQRVLEDARTPGQRLLLLHLALELEDPLPEGLVLASGPPKGEVVRPETADRSRPRP